MTSLGLEPRTLGPRAGDRAPGGGDSSHRDSTRAIDAAGVRRGDGRGGGDAGLIGAVVGEIVALPTLVLAAIGLYIALIAPPLLTLLPIALVALLTQAIGVLSGGLS